MKINNAQDIFAFRIIETQSNDQSEDQNNTQDKDQSESNEDDQL